MNTLELNSIIEGDCIAKCYFKGTYSWNTIPQLENNTACISNSLCDKRQGEHWVAYTHINHRLEFFCSFGFPAEFYETLPSFGIDEFNKKQLQSFNSQTCGMWASYYILKRCRGFSMENIILPFTDDLHANDHCIASFFEENFGFEIPIHV